MVVFFLCPFSYFFGVFIKILNLIVLPTEKYNTHFLTFCPSIRLTFAALVFGALFFLLIQRPERVCRSSSSRSHNRSMAEKKVKKSKMGEGVKPTILPHFTSTIHRKGRPACLRGLHRTGQVYPWGGAHSKSETKWWRCNLGGQLIWSGKVSGRPKTLQNPVLQLPSTQPPRFVYPDTVGTVLPFAPVSRLKRNTMF